MKSQSPLKISHWKKKSILYHRKGEHRHRSNLIKDFERERENGSTDLRPPPVTGARSWAAAPLLGRADFICSIIFPFPLSYSYNRREINRINNRNSRIQKRNRINCWLYLSLFIFFFLKNLLWFPAFWDQRSARCFDFGSHCRKRRIKGVVTWRALEVELETREAKGKAPGLKVRATWDAVRVCRF